MTLAVLAILQNIADKLLLISASSPQKSSSVPYTTHDKLHMIKLTLTPGPVCQHKDRIIQVSTITTINSVHFRTVLHIGMQIIMIMTIV